jgi:hypothetical protein
MEDLLKRAIDLLPKYIRDLLSLLSGPKHFVAHRVTARRPLEAASLFLAISVAINFLLKLPFSDDNPAYEILRTAAFSLVLWMMAGVVIWLAWRAVGGTGTIDRTLAIAFYFFGVLEYVMSLTALAIVGALRTIDPPLYDSFVKALHEGQFLQLVIDLQPLDRAGLQVAMAFVVLGIVAALTWIVAGWGGFRTAHKLGEGKSALAFVLAGIIWVPLWALTGVIANGMAP